MPERCVLSAYLGDAEQPGSGRRNVNIHKGGGHSKALEIFLDRSPFLSAISVTAKIAFCFISVVFGV